VNIELNIVTCPTYPDKFIRDNVVAPSVPTSVVTVYACSLVCVERCQSVQSLGIKHIFQNSPFHLKS